MKFIIKVLPILFFIGLILNKLPKANAALIDWGYVSADVDISICGDTVVEGPEDCEGADLDGESCISLGYKSGTLSCDIACQFDETQCVPFPPPPPDENDDDDDGDDDDDDGDDDDDDGDDDSSSSTQLLTQPSTGLTRIPPRLPATEKQSLDSILRAKLLLYDPDGDGVITYQERSYSIEEWVRAWKSYTKKYEEDLSQRLSPRYYETCDFNFDDRCNIIDFSILLYYIERK